MNLLIENHRTQILWLAEKWGVYNVRIFGSMSRDNATNDSDVDLLVNLQAQRTGLALGGFLQDVSELLGKRVDVVTEPALHPRLRERILREAIPL